MSVDMKNNQPDENQKLNVAAAAPSTAAADRSNTLDDEARIRVLSPGMLVFKRFVRNRLAMIGAIILIVMFVFAFIGGLLTPYGQAQVFKHDEEILKDYASATLNTELRYTVEDGMELSAADRAQVALAISKNKPSFESGGNSYVLRQEMENFYSISGATKELTVNLIGGKYDYQLSDQSLVLTPEFKTAIEGAITAKKQEVNIDGTVYTLVKSGKSYTVSTTRAFALAALQVFDAAKDEDSALVDSFAFRYACLMAIAQNQTEFVCKDVTYQLKNQDDEQSVYQGSQVFAVISDTLVSPKANDVVLSLELKDLMRKAIRDKQDSFELNDVKYVMSRVNSIYNFKTLTSSRLISVYQSPTADHLLGTDGNGMDVLTRLMYGGRISLMVGFVVVFLETFIGVIVGGISGYFGGWVDTLLMRFVDLFNCIPFYPTVMIVGAVMDKMEVGPYARIFLLMGILGVLGWTGIARVVRGQILSLREQDFMVATEASGIRVSRRIFRHLVPNVMPLLIVQATMSLGSVIISEATLSFLGLGVQYPLASWGSMINAANDQYVLTNYWFIWIPAGLLIVLTVLGFNFIGDGLRDAFDPKMKR